MVLFHIRGHNTLPSKKLFDNRAELNRRIETCHRIMDLPDEMREPKRNPVMDLWLESEDIYGLTKK